MLACPTHRRFWLQRLLVTLLLTVLVIAPGRAQADEQDPAALKQTFRRPDSIPFPADRPHTPEAALLGRTLFFDARLSGSGSLACASCHNPSFGWEDGLTLGHGEGLRDLARHSPTILNSAWGRVFFWDGRAPSLEAQALGPMGSPSEMHSDLAGLPARIAAIRGYQPMFDRAFPGDAITLDTITRAIATFERTVASQRAPFDDWIEGDEAAIPEPAKRGFVAFVGTGHCAACHSGWAFTDGRFHDIGLADDNPGRAAVAPGEPEAMHGFKTPTLRDVDRRAPYMHDGSLSDLRAVVAHYAQGVARPTRAPLSHAPELTAAQTDDIVAFLHTLSGPARSFPAPTLPQ